MFEIALLLTLTLFLLILTRVFSLPLTSLPCITGLVWIFFIYASLLLLKDYTWGYYGLLWILISCVLITFGFVAGKKIAKQTHASYHRREPLKPNRVLIKKFLYVSIALGLA